MNRDDEVREFHRQKALYEKACQVNGRHYVEYVEEVKQLKRMERYDEAEKLILAVLDACEQASKIPIPTPLRPDAEPYFNPVPPGWYRELAIIYRKQKRYDDEVALLERYSRQVGAGIGYDPTLDRLTKARQLQQKARTKSDIADTK